VYIRPWCWDDGQVKSQRLGYGSYRVIMSGNPFNSFGPSDSGMLNGFADLLPGQLRIDSAKQSLHGDGLPGVDESHCEHEPLDGDIDRRIRDVALPAGFLARMREAAVRFAV
jgi:hypothetical protein